MVTRSKIKTMIYQNLVQDSDLQVYLGANYLEKIAESGQEIQSNNIKYPAIRYRIVSDIPALLCRDCQDRRHLIFDIMFETRMESKYQSDDLIDLVRDIFTNQNKKRISDLTVTPAYNSDVGILNKTKNQPELYATDCKEIGMNQIGSSDEPTEGAGIKGDMLNGRLQHTMIRFECYVLDNSVYA